MVKYVNRQLYDTMIDEGMRPDLKGFWYLHEFVVGREDLTEGIYAGYTRVAKKFGVSTPAVYAGIQYLKTDMGVKTNGWTNSRLINHTYAKAFGDRGDGDLPISHRDCVLDGKIAPIAHTPETSPLQYQEEVTPLTRTQIRQLERERQRASATVQLSYGQLQAIKSELKSQAAEEATKQAFILMLGFPILAIKDLFEVTPIVLETVVDKILSYFNSFNNGDITLEDLWSTIESEAGLTINTTVKGNDIQWK